MDCCCVDPWLKAEAVWNGCNRFLYFDILYDISQIIIYASQLGMSLQQNTPPVSFDPNLATEADLQSTKMTFTPDMFPQGKIHHVKLHFGTYYVARYGLLARNTQVFVGYEHLAWLFS